MKVFTSFALFALLTASASLSFAQTTQNPYSWMPMFSLWGGQATATATTTVSAPTTQTAAPSSFQELLSIMPMFRFFNFSQ